MLPLSPLGDSPIALPSAVSRCLGPHGLYQEREVSKVMATRANLFQVGFLGASNKGLGVLFQQIYYLSRTPGRARKLGSEAKPPESWNFKSHTIRIKIRTKN